MKDILDLVGRILLAIIFFFEAYDSIIHYEQTKISMASYGLTWRQDLLLGGAIFVLVLGATLILLGYRAALGALMLLLYWLPFSFIVYSFWNDPFDIKREVSILFMKNMAIAGGLLLVWAHGSGKYSVRRLLATYRVRGT